VREPTTDCKNINNARYDILTEALMKFLFFLVYRYRRFGGACCLHYQSNPGTLLYSFWTTLKMEASNFSETLDLTYQFTRRLSNWNLKTKIVFIPVVVQAGNASLRQQVNVVGNFAFRRQGVA